MIKPRMDCENHWSNLCCSQGTFGVCFSLGPQLRDTGADRILSQTDPTLKSFLWLIFGHQNNFLLLCDKARTQIAQVDFKEVRF